LINHVYPFISFLLGFIIIYLILLSLRKRTTLVVKLDVLILTFIKLKFPLVFLFLFFISLPLLKYLLFFFIFVNPLIFFFSAFYIFSRIILAYLGYLNYEIKLESDIDSFFEGNILKKFYQININLNKKKIELIFYFFLKKDKRIKNDIREVIFFFVIRRLMGFPY